jgi:cyclic beta-1,2-glucan synthetase
MAHHQGMSLLAIANFLNDGVVQTWFHSHPRVQATELLLDEKPANMIAA